MAAPSLQQHTFLPLFSILMTAEVFSVAVTPIQDTRSLICTNPGYQYARHPLDCSRWFHCPGGQPIEMSACIDSMAFSMISLTCLPRRNENNDCVSTCEFDGKLRYLGETFDGKNSCQKCICQNNRGIVFCSNACLSTGGNPNFFPRTWGTTCSYNKRTYQVGQYFMNSDGCNTCLCERQGVIRCTDIKCRTNKVTCYHQETVYVAGETFSHLDGQHTCTCRLDGVVSCSLSHAGQTEDETSCLYDEKRHKAGTVFLSVDHCNQCECLDSGHVTCTEFNCSSPRPLLNALKVLNSVTPVSNSIASPPTTQIVVVCYYEKNEYKPGDTFTASDGCNSCLCSRTGKVHCTQKLCPQPRVSHANRLQTCFYAGQRYQFRDHFNSTDGCNTCHCTQNGRVQCTELTCLPTWNRMLDRDMCMYGEKEYREGESFFALDGCNYCNCGQYGHVECTDRDCQSSPGTTMTTTMAMTILSTSTKARPSRPMITCFHEGKQYNVGETYSTKCDICYCSLNGHVHCIRLTCPPESDKILLHSPSQHPDPHRATSTASENYVLSSSNDAESTRVANINASKLFAINDTDSVTASNMQKQKHFPTIIPFTYETPLTNQSITLEKSTVATMLELNTQHSANKAFLGSAAKNTVSNQLPPPSATASTAQLQNIIVGNTRLLWDLDSQNASLDLSSLLARIRSKNEFPSSKSETLLSNILPPTLLNFSTEAENPAKLISTDVPQTERPPLPKLPNFTTSNNVALATTFKSDMIEKKGVIAELQKGEINGRFTNGLELITHSVRGTSDPNESTINAIPSVHTDQGLTTKTVQSESRDFVTLPELSMITSDGTLHSEISTKNETESSSSSPGTSTNHISSISNTINSTFQKVSKVSFVTTTREFSTDLTAQPESLSLSTLINTPTAISTLNQAATFSTPSPSAITTTPSGTTVIPISKDYNNIISGFAILNNSNPSTNKENDTEHFTETSSKIVPEVTVPVSVNHVPPSSTASIMQDRSPKNIVSLVSDLGSINIASSVSFAETGTPTSDSVHDVGSKTPQTMQYSMAPADTVYFSVQPRPFISNILSTTPTSVVGSPTSVFTTKTTAANSFDISTNSSFFSSSAATMIPNETISSSSSTFTNQGTLTTHTADDSNPSTSDKQSEVTPSIVTRETLSNRLVSDITAEPFKQHMRTTITTPHFETNTPIYSISKRTSVPPYTAPLIEPISVIPVTRSYNRHFSELSVTESKKVSKITSTTLKSIPAPTADINKAVLISSPFSKTPRPLLSHLITTPIVSSTKPIPLTKTNSKLMPIVSEEHKLDLDPVSCYYNGRKYQIWDVFMSQDDCNTCECLYNGIIHCTEFPCRDKKERMLPVPTQTMTPYVSTTLKNLPTTPALEAIPCYYNGMRYKLWDVFSSVDGCNTCDCLYHGIVHCTNRRCATKNDIPVKSEYSHIPIPETCKYKDQVYQIGQTFLSEDKCTICNCTFGGHISCTNIHCPSENIQLNDQKSQLLNKISPIPMVSRRPNITMVSTTHKMTAAAVVKRALCWYNGLSYQSGDKFNSEDDCNTCTCTPDSLVTCTQLPCTSKNTLSDRSTCAYNGHAYQNGQMFSSADGCNTCGCLDDGIILCTSQVCRFGKDKLKAPVVTNSPVKCSYNGKTYNEGDVFNLTENCNLCNCTQSGQVECTQKACRQEPERLQYDAPVNVPAAVTCSFEGRLYKPRQVFQMADGCNVCTCKDDGRIICTNKKCLLNNNESRGRQNSAATLTTTTILMNQPFPKLCSYDGQTFQAGKTFSAIDGCNSCNCTIDGEVKCSQRKCPLNIAGQSNAIAESLSFHVGVTCIYGGEIYKAQQVFPSSDGCNTCRCSDGGRIHCTDTLCPIKSNQSKGKAQLVAKITSTTNAPILERCSYNRQIYRVGDTFYSIDGCNLCNCSHNGVVKCDQKSCLPRNEEASKDVAMSFAANVGVTCFYEGQVYQPLQVFPSADGCNTCACSDAGQVHCTEAVCSDRKQPKGEERLQDGTPGSCIFGGKRYTVGDTFDVADGCNICGCSDRGKILCTNRTCYPGILQNRESPQTVEATTPTPQVTRPKKTLCHYNGHSYISGRIFKAADSCNMCGCLLNGKVHCTKNSCNLKIAQTTVPPRTSAVPEHNPLVKCRYFGQKYNVGQMFGVQDGCNKCACLPEGIVRCTKHRCDPPVVFCKHGGNVYFIGQTFADDCNTCKCGVHGIITCTELHCDNEDDDRCEYNGQEHKQGDTFRSSDGCHLCTCSSNARISCRPIPCQVTRNRFGTSQERSEEEYLDD